MRHERITARARADGWPAVHPGFADTGGYVVAMIAEGMSQMKSSLPTRTLSADIGEGLRYAAEAVRERELPLKTLA
jgi:hypothetical protein